MAGWLSQPKIQARLIGLAAIAATLLVLVTAVVWSPNWISKPRSVLPFQVAVDFIPRQAALTAVLNVPLQRTVPARLQPLIAGLEQATGFSSSEILPWLGSEAVISLLPFGAPAKPGGLLVFSVADGDRAREFLELFWQRQAIAGTPLALSTVNGAQLISPTSGRKSPANPAWSTALVANQYVLMASDPEILRQSLRAAQVPQLSLAHRRGYQTAAQLPSHPNGELHLNLPAALSLLTPTLPAEGQVLRWQELTLAIAASDRAIDLYTALTANPAHPPAAQDPPISEPVSQLAFLPPETAAAATGQDLRSRWRALRQAAQTYPWLLPLQPLPATTLDDISDSVEVWLTGTYAIGRTASGDWILAAEKTAAADSAIAALDQIARDHQLTVTPLTVAQQPVTAWTRLKTTVNSTPDRRETAVETTVVALHTRRESTDLFATSVAAMAAALQAPDQPLSSTAAFKQAIAPLDRPNQGSVYLNWTQLAPTLRPPVPLLDLAKTVAQPLLQELKTVSVSSYRSQSDYVPGQIHLEFSSP